MLEKVFIAQQDTNIGNIVDRIYEIATFEEDIAYYILNLYEIF